MKNSIKTSAVLFILVLIGAGSVYAATSSYVNYCGGNLLNGLHSMKPYIINETNYHGIFTHTKCELNAELLTQGKTHIISEYKKNNTINAEDFDLLLRLVEKERKVTYEGYFDNDCIPFSDNLIIPDKSRKELILYFNSVDLENPIVILYGHDGTQKIVPLKISKPELREKTIDYFNQLSNIDTDLNELKALSAELYDLYLRPIEHYLQTAMFEHLTIIQDTETQLIPFESLYDEKQNEYVLEKLYSISYRPNLSEYAYRYPAKNHKTAILAYPLSEDDPNTDNHLAEATAIASITPGSTHLSGDDFSILGVMNLLNNSSHSILHISSHAEFKAPFAQSAIELSNAQEMKVTDLEKTIRSAALRYHPLDLLVLSACQTARSYQANKVKPEEMIQASLGLAGVAARSGAKSVVASLWNVLEADQILIDAGTTFPSIQGRDFYSLINQHPNLSLAMALKQAKLNFIADEYRKQRPYLWSAYILIGEPGGR